ncbi:MAG: Hsp20/alpha crystallin family protein [Deltaproteobacteria bacterium]|nr:Hsp20/alpha crystallin family protein [Deltaproteobacteria bacterium]
MTSMLQLVPRRDGFLSLFPGTGVFDQFFNDLELPDLLGEEGMLVPAFDISETEKEYMITGEIPGIDAKELDITLLDGILTIKGEKKQEKEDKDENYHRVERHYGSFQRNFRIPEKVKTDKLDATYKDGVLKLTLPKAEASEAKKIEVKEEGKKKK